MKDRVINYDESRGRVTPFMLFQSAARLKGVLLSVMAEEGAPVTAKNFDKHYSILVSGKTILIRPLTELGDKLLDQFSVAK